MLNLSNIFKKINISNLIEDKTNLAVDLGVHSLILFTILTCFFLLYITKITKSAINSHLGELIEEHSAAIVKKSKELGGLQVKLLAKNEDGKYTKNDSIKIIEFINGYSPTAERIQVECLGIIPVKFSTNIDIEEDDFKALEGTNSIRIILGKLL